MAERIRWAAATDKILWIGFLEKRRYNKKISIYK
jgi:hypothetical protein